ncbi:Fc.00g015780.m01.CDS01 [Cosmosporella sp. VM-42]
MSNRTLTQASRLATRTLRSSNVRRTSYRLTTLAPRIVANVPRRSFASTQARARGIMPETENPAKEAAKPEEVTIAVAELSDNEYHELADEYLDNVLAKFEDIADAREDVDVEFSAGVLTISYPDKGTYVVNKQPPNKQIWLSSPISGPKRYDWCIIGDGQGDKEGTASGRWIYTRDGSSLSEIFANELEVDVDIPHVG